jgi:hypothetical protein
MARIAVGVASSLELLDAIGHAFMLAQVFGKCDLYGLHRIFNASG